MADVYLKGKIMDNFNKAHNAYLKACKGISVKENEKIVLECRTGWCYDFARDIKGADIKAHEKVILELNNPKYSCYFAEYIAVANIEEHFKVIYNSGYKYWFNYFIKYVNYKNTKVEKWLLYI